MIKKEFYKFKEAFFVFVVLIAAFLGYIFFELRSAVLDEGNLKVNLIFLLQKGFSFYHLGDINLLFSVVISCFVFGRERQNERLRLSLFFPNKIFKNIAYIVLYPLIFIFGVYASEILILNVFLSHIYVSEILSVINFWLILNFLFGLIFYLLTGAIIITPLKKNATLNLGVFFGILYLYFELNPDIYELQSFHSNDLGMVYFLIFFMYALSALVLSFDAYRKGL